MVGNGVSSGEFLDYPSPGVDNDALYIGGNMFDAVSGSFCHDDVDLLIRKSSIFERRAGGHDGFPRNQPLAGTGPTARAE